MQPAQAFYPDVTTFLTHLVGLADKRYVVQRFKSMFDSDIRPVEAKNRKNNRAICVDGGVAVWCCGRGSVIVVRFVVGTSADVSRWNGRC